jgi:FkbM family methyltransferase
MKIIIFYIIQVKRKILRSIRLLLSLLNIALLKYSDLEKIRAENLDYRDRINKINQSEYDKLFFHELDASPKLNQLINSSQSSEIHQDLFVLALTNYKQNGFFVEFGAADGKNGSNTYLLEKNFNWTGILAEPSKNWHSKLKINRLNAKIDTDCVWSQSNQILEFSESVDQPYLSTISEFEKHDFHSNSRKHSKSYNVKTISLYDLLKKHNAPSYIDYLSIDTEGSEFEILEKFDFNTYKFGIITCEHNFTENRIRIYNLLIKNGYKRVYEKLSKYDDWYVSLQ